MQRRSVLKAGALLSIAGGLPRFALGAGPQADDWAAAFASALEDDPRLLGWATPAFDSIDSGVLRVEGQWPRGLGGTFWRNGPAIHDRHGLRYQHWFDGDGMIQEFRVSEGAVRHRARLIATPKLLAEDEASRRLYRGFGTPVRDGLPVRRPDDLNTANISVLEHHGELLALWEGGSASRLDHETLEWQGFKSWGEGLQGVPFTAHPKLDPDGTLWAFGYATGAQSMLVLYHISCTGDLVKMALVPVDPLGILHDFVVTQRHLVFLIPPLVVDAETGASLLDSHVWRPKLGSRVLVVSKDDFDNRRWYDLPPAFGFHHGNAWEEADGRIYFDQCLDKDAGLVLHSLGKVMRGNLNNFFTARYARMRLDPSGSAHMEITSEIAEFPQVAPSVVGHKNRYVYYLGVAENADWYLQTLVKRDHERGTIESYDFGQGKIPEEHVFVPSYAGGGEDAGWLLGTFLDYERGVTGLSVFDAQRLSDGPLATAWLPYPLPLGFHGCFRAHKKQSA